MSQLRHQIYTASYEFLQVCNFLLILMRPGAREDSSGFVKERAGKEENKEFWGERGERETALWRLKPHTACKS